MSQLFLQGKAAMIYAGTWSTATFLDQLPEGFEFWYIALPARAARHWYRPARPGPTCSCCPRRAKNLQTGVGPDEVLHHAAGRHHSASSCPPAPRR